MEKSAVLRVAKHCRQQITIRIQPLAVGIDRAFVISCCARRMHDHVGLFAVKITGLEWGRLCDELFIISTLAKADEPS